MNAPEQLGSQPWLGIVGGLLLVLPLTIVLAVGAGGSSRSVLVLVRSVVKVHAPAGVARLHGGVMKGADFGVLMVVIGMWQTLLYVVLHGWPLTTISSRGARLAAANAAVIGGGLLTYWALAAALDASTISAAAGCVIAAGLVAGMLFEGWPRWAARLRAIALVAVLAVILYGALSAIAVALDRHRVAAAEWVSYAGLNAIGLPVILHVGIGRRWPFQVRTGVAQVS